MIRTREINELIELFITLPPEKYGRQFSLGSAIFTILCKDSPEASRWWINVSCIWRLTSFAKQIELLEKSGLIC